MTGKGRRFEKSSVGLSARPGCEPGRIKAPMSTAGYRSIRLSLEVDQLLKDFITGGNDLGIGLIGTLGGNHLHKFCGQVHIGHFQGGRRHRTEAGRIRGGLTRAWPDSVDSAYRLLPIFDSPE